MGLPGDAALAVLHAGRGASHVLCLLEFGCGVMVGIELDNRSEILHVESDEYPELFQRSNTLHIKTGAVDEKPLHLCSKMHGGGKCQEAVAKRLVEEFVNSQVTKTSCFPHSQAT